MKVKKQLIIIMIAFIILLLFLCCTIYDKNEVETISNNTNSEIEKEIQENNYRTLIEELPENYTWQQAVEDNCVVRTNSDQIYNTDVFDEFLQKVKDNEPSFIRSVTFTIEGDMIITDINFEGKNIFKVCRDSTRDKYSIQEERKYHYATFTEIVIEELEGGVKANLKGAIDGEFQSIYVSGYEKEDEKINKSNRIIHDE